MDKRRKPSDTRQKPISKERLSHLASFLELSPDPVMELDLSGNIQYLNPAAKRLFPDLPEKGIKHPYLAGWETLAASLRDKEGIGFRREIREIKVNDAWYVQLVEYAPASRTIRICGSDITDRKIAEEALKASEQRLRNFIENLPIGIAVVTPDGRAIQRNKYLKELYGYKTEDAIATTVTSHYYDPKDRGRFLKLVEKGPVSNFEVRLKHDDGEMFWGSLSSQYQTTPAGEKQIVTVVQDITERKQTEEALKASEEKFRNLVENAPIGIAISSPDGRPIQRNVATQKMHGYDSKEEFMKVHQNDLYYDVADRKRFLELARKGPVRDFEVRRKRKDGSPFWVSLTSIPNTAESSEQQFIVIVQDITERKGAEEALRESEAKYSTLVEQGNDGIAIIGDGLIEFANSRLLKVSGFSLEETLGKPFIDFLAPADRNVVIDRYQKRIRGENVPNNYEISIIAKNGMLIPVEISASLIDYKGKAADMAIIRDITGRKQAEVTLRASEAKFRNLVENAPVGIAISTPDGPSFERNKAFQEMHGYDSRKEFMKVSTDDLYYDVEDRKRFLELATRGPVRGFEVRHKRKDGSCFWVSQSTIPFVTESGEHQLIAVVQDIDEKKKAEEEIQLKAHFLDSAGDMIYLHDLTGKIIYANDAVCKTHGYTRDEVMQMNIRNLLTPERAEMVSPIAQETLEKGDVKFETQHVCKNGSLVPVEVYNRLIKLGDGYAIIGVGRDITERKKAEEALRASEAKFRTMVENLPVGVAVSNVEGRSPERNKAFMEMHGYTSREEFDKIPAVELYFNPEDRKRFLSKLGKGAVRNFEIRHKRKDGSPFWISLSAIPRIGEHGGKQSLVICQDIDERKRAEEALKVSEERFRSLLENAPVGITVSTTDGRRLEANKALIQMQGFGSREELLAAPVADTYYDPEERKLFMSLLEKGPVQNYELRRKRKDGSVFWASLNSITYIDSSGEKLLINVIADISERKRAEEALKASEERYRSLVEELPIGIGVSTLEGRSIQRNKALMEMLGYKTKEELSLVDTPTLYYDPTDRQRFLKLAEKGPVRGFETRFKRQDGTVFWASLSSISQVTPSGEMLRLNVIQDIDTEKKAEEENELKAMLLDSAGDTIHLIDRWGR